MEYQKKNFSIMEDWSTCSKELWPYYCFNFCLGPIVSMETLMLCGKNARAMVGVNPDSCIIQTQDNMDTLHFIRLFYMKGSSTNSMLGRYIIKKTSTHIKLFGTRLNVGPSLSVHHFIYTLPQKKHRFLKVAFLLGKSVYQ